MIGEWEAPVSPKATLILLVYPVTVYLTWSITFWDSDNTSPPNLSKRLIDSPLICGSNIAPVPGAVTLIVVFVVAYPIPVLITTTFTISPFSTTALNLAPIAVPKPTTSKSGAALYSSPPFCTCTDIILPLEITGLNYAFLPFFIFTRGFLSKFKTVDP